MKKVVIIGGGIAGTSTAQKLDGKLDVTLIERKNAYHHNIAAMRAVVDETYRWQQFVPYTSVFKHTSTSRVVHGDVVGVEGGVVKTSQGQSFPYDYLVIATGSQNPFPAKLDALSSVQDGIKRYAEIGAIVGRSNRILIVGGGPVGVELAGEIRAISADKEITILHRGRTLFSNQGGAPALPRKFVDTLLSILQSQNVKVILEDSVELPKTSVSYEEGPKTFKTAKGQTLECDLVIWCTGNRPNTAAFKEFLGNSLDAAGQIRVSPQLRVESHENVFALGDVTNIPEPKLQYIAQSLHVPVVVKNILALANGKQPSATHKPFANTSFAVVGPHVGLSQVGFLPGFMGGVHRKGPLATMKNSQRLFTPRTWKDITGRPIPNTSPY